MRPRRRISNPAFILTGLFVLAVYLLTGSSDLKHNGDTDLRYQTAQAIVDHHRLWLSNPLWRDSRVAHGVEGHLYAYYAPGQSIFMVPLYVIGKVIAHHLSLPYDITTQYASRSLDLWLGVATALLLFLFARSIGFSHLTSGLLTALYSFATPAWPDAQSALDETQVTFFLLLAVFAVWQGRKRDGNAVFWFAMSGLALGMAIFTRYDSLLYAPIFGVFIVLQAPLLRSSRRALKQLTAFAGGLTLPLLGVALWNEARFGSPFLTGLHEATFWENPWDGLLGLLVSPGKGLTWYMPTLVLLFFSVRPFSRRVGQTGTLILATCIATLVFYSNVLFWHGDPAWGPRYLYVMLPYLVLPLGEILERWKQRNFPVRASLVLLVVAGLALQISAVSVTQWRSWYRLEALQQQTVQVNTWSGQPFRWGSTHYHYYWNLRESPIVLQVDDLYQVSRLLLGDQKYKLIYQPDPYIASNTAANYPVNTFAFWWLDPLHPLLGRHTRLAIATILFLIAVLALGLLIRCFARMLDRAAVPARTVSTLAGAAQGGP